jgi:hypothetical protein
VKSEGFGPILVSNTVTTGADGSIASAFLGNRTPSRPSSRREVKTVAERHGRKKSLKNVRGSPGEPRTRKASVGGCALGTWTATDSLANLVFAGSCFSCRPQSSFGETRRLDRSPTKTRERPLCVHKQEAHQPPGATESGGATATIGSGRGGGANAAESAGAAGSGGLPPTRKLERQRDRRDREREAVPSAGWRSVARALSAEEGCSHR